MSPKPVEPTITQKFCECVGNEFGIDLTPEFKMQCDKILIRLWLEGIILVEQSGTLIIGGDER